jgi:glutaminyl-tRNA synthetase
MYRILRARHHRTGDAWCIYPMYDWAHGQCDAFEGITHSICTLEFEDHRPLYDWFLEHLDIGRPRQIEFARLNISHTVLSKRKLLRLVRDGIVGGWDDPRMPTLSGLRRRGYPPEAIRRFCERIGVAKVNSTVDAALLEDCVRDDLNKTARRVMGVLRPLRLIVESYPEGEIEELPAVNNPEDPGSGTRPVKFARELLIEESDFREDPPPKFFRLAPGREVRLRYAYIIKCTGVDKDPATGRIVAVRCVHDPATRGGSAPAGKRIQGTIHWVSAAHALPAEVRLYEHLFTRADPDEADEGYDFLANLNAHSLEVIGDARVEPVLASAPAGTRVQFERQGYFCVDPDSTPARLVFNRTVTLRDTWAKIEKRA